VFSAQISCAANANYVMDRAKEESETKHSCQPDIKVIGLIVEKE